MNHLDLFPDAFAELADPSKGVIETTWEFVECPITSPLQLHNKDGVSAYWFSMQVVNADKAVTSLEVSTDGGSTWQGTTRQTYNFFENSSGFGTTTVDVKVTSVDGDVVIVDNVEVVSDASTTASSNFGSAIGDPNVSPAAKSVDPTTLAIGADVSTTSSPSTSPTQDATPTPVNSDMPGIFGSSIVSTDDPLPTSAPTTTSEMAAYSISPTTTTTAIATTDALSTSGTPSLATAETVTVYSYENCTPVGNVTAPTSTFSNPSRSATVTPVGPTASRSASSTGTATTNHAHGILVVAGMLIMCFL